MFNDHDRGPLDGLIELAGASAPAVAASFAAAWLAPPSGWPPVGAVLAAGTGTFAAAFVAMRLVPAEPRVFELPQFDIALPDDEPLLEDIAPEPEELLLDQPFEEAAADAVAELLLDDLLPAPAPDSRVVALFAEGRMPTAGQLKHRIDRHLADGRRPAPAPPMDGGDALSEALAELRRSLRQA